MTTVIKHHKVWKSFNDGLEVSNNGLGFSSNQTKMKTILRDFLINKKQTVVLNRQVSTLTSVNARTPQGPMLGPIIYAV